MQCEFLLASTHSSDSESTSDGSREAWETAPRWAHTEGALAMGPRAWREGRCQERMVRLCTHVKTWMAHNH